MVNTRSVPCVISHTCADVRLMEGLPLLFVCVPQVNYREATTCKTIVRNHI